MLEDYREKRNFESTGEPRGAVSSSGKPIFVVQKHDASHLHYDLRLEMDGVLKSWAVPKEPPGEEGVKRLAVQTEDHPLDYADFEGVIPEGNYGAGTVERWDGGSLDIIDRGENKIIFKLDGEKLKGDYVLLRMRKSEPKNWLFFKKHEK